MPIEVPPLTGKQKKPAATEWGAVPQTPPRVHAMEGHAASCETMPFTNPDDEFLQTESRTVGARGWQERDGVRTSRAPRCTLGRWHSSGDGRWGRCEHTKRH